MSSKARNMTSGSIPRHLVRYSIPAILGDLFQVTYNTVDSVIVGQFAGAGALAAVGVASPLMSVAMFFIIGMGIGASVLMSEFYGAGDMPRLRRQFATTLAMGAGFSVLIALGLFMLTGPLLRLCHTPDAIFPETARYLRIVALGMVVTSMYNILAAASRSIGDTLTPLICLVAGSLVNVGLDMLFVARFAWGVAGAAWATVISQALSALLCAWLLRRNEPMLFAGQGDFKPDRALFGRTLRFSAPSALQQAGIYVGKLLVQSAVNPLGVSAIAAFNAVNRIDDYALIPERDIANGETVLVAQNRGAGKADRMRRGFFAAMALEVAYGLVVSVAVFALAEPLMGLFVDPGEAEVIRLGTRYLRLMGLFYILPGITNGLQGYMRALGKLKLTMVVTYGQMFTRAACTFLLIGRLGLDAVPLACVAGWVMMTVWEVGLMIQWRRKGHE
ncbi:MAG: MATE family efflux transporter [Clostridia bacterium]|nr:MATE family efflux transporter [Clostridia bacterium]